jgi:hypothetical protein
MRICILGTCQVSGMAAAMSRMIPSLEIDTHMLFFTSETAADEAAAKAVTRGDIVIQQPTRSPMSSMTQRALEEARNKTITAPVFAFRGFHPDQTYALELPWGAYRTPTGDYHSLIIAAGYAAGLSPAETRARFNSLSYARLGYFDVFEEDFAVMTEQFARVGMDFPAMAARWRRNGPFMHTINHPKIEPLADIAAALLLKAGLGNGVRPHDLPEDGLGKSLRTPVYPEIARRLGVKGAYDHLLEGGQTRLNLEAFIEGAFAVYDQMPPGLLASVSPVRNAAEKLGLDLKGEGYSRRVAAQRERSRLALLCRPGETFDCTQQQVTVHLAQGWGRPEAGHGVWTIGTTSVLKLNADAPADGGSLSLSINATPFITETCDRLKVEVSVNGTIMADWNYRWVRGKSAGGVRTVDLPLSLAPGGAFTITFRIDQPRSPDQVGLSADRRQLGIVLHHFGIEPAPPWKGQPPRLRARQFFRQVRQALGGVKPGHGARR